MPLSDDYIQGSSYENFINRAHKYHGQSLKNGASGSYMSNLIEAEKGGSSVKHLGSYEKQLAKVKEYISKAIDAFLKPARKLNPEEKQQLERLKDYLNSAHSPSQLMAIVKEGLDVTHPYKEY